MGPMTINDTIKFVHEVDLHGLLILDPCMYICDSYYLLAMYIHMYIIYAGHIN